MPTLVVGMWRLCNRSQVANNAFSINHQGHLLLSPEVAKVFIQGFIPEERIAPVNKASGSVNRPVPEGRNRIARGVSPWNTPSNTNKAPKGRQLSPAWTAEILNSSLLLVLLSLRMADGLYMGYKEELPKHLPTTEGL